MKVTNTLVSKESIDDESKLLGTVLVIIED